ncbi:alpha/beta hydrolase [Algoriphagus vanfongensis]|uniref:alpha/beta hydrolase n=1 Tax=Algoriphagus vanfongensis TaxID=426371 RepID=UPI000409814D|nr:alpha/beta hydrolase-fold protein [Algoriphagus vanfongensis]
MSIDVFQYKTGLYLIAFLLQYHVALAQKPITIGHQYQISSQILDEEREIWISLPDSYEDSIYSQKNYPVCYFFDGNLHFENLVAQTNRLSSGLYAEMPEVILVGIIQKDRTQELTPTAMATPEEWKRADFSSSGGNLQFMEFVEQELKAWVNQEFRTNGYEILIGHSFGGLAVANALITHPERFDAYVPIDASMWWDSEKLLSSIDSLWNPLKYEGKTLFLAKANDSGSGEDHHNALFKFRDEFNRLQPGSPLRYRYTFYEKEGHGSVVVPAEYEALRFIFEGYEMPVKQVMKDPSLLDGHYEEVSKRLGYRVLPDEKMIDDLAKVCERQELNEQAKELLRRNTVYYPQSKHAKKRYLNFEDK